MRSGAGVDTQAGPDKASCEKRYPALTRNEFERPLIVTRYWFLVKRNAGARRSRFQATVEILSRVCEKQSPCGVGVRTRSGSDGIIHSS